MVLGTWSDLLSSLSQYFSIFYTHDLDDNECQTAVLYMIECLDLLIATLLLVFVEFTRICRIHIGFQAINTYI